MVNLQALGLDNIQIDDYGFLEEFADLKTLSLCKNQINDYSFLKKLKSLEDLVLENNQISNCSFLQELTSLKKLNLRNNQIWNIQDLENLTELQELDLRNNQISDISFLLPLIKKGIPISLKEYDSENKINVYDNPITHPPLEIVQQGNAAILRYFAERKRSGAQKLMEAKLLIVGQGGAGKTSLKKKLHDPDAEMPKPEDTTRGIEVTNLECQTSGGENFQLNIWDFGGQNIQHYAHQFFLTGSSLYALVHNERRQDTDFQYWLNIIEMLGNKSPILIVQNEIAGHSEPIKNAAAIRERFGNVVNPFQQVDLSQAATDSRFANLRDAIIHHAVNLPHVGREYPTSYVRVREALEQETERGKHYITWSAYKKLCAAADIDDADVMQDIATTFTILGACLHFKDDLVLKKYVFLNPKWIIDALFQLIYHDKVIEQKGRFSELDADEIWAHADYDDMEDKLIRIMENFELCYRIKDSKDYIVPQRLPAEDESYGWDAPNATKVQYDYKFMPKGLITRLTCRLHEKIENEHVWNDAVIFAMPKARAFVREVYAEERIAIEVTGDKRGDLLNRILDEVDDIHRKSNFANLQVEKLVPCSCPICSEAKEPHFFDYDYLIELLDEGEYDERCKVSKKKIDIRDVLNKTGIDYKKDRRRGRWKLLDDRPTLGRQDEAIVLTEKIAHLRKRLAIGVSAAEEFTIQQQIEEAEKRLNELREP